MLIEQFDTGLKSKKDIKNFLINVKGKNTPFNILEADIEDIDLNFRSLKCLPH